MDSSLFQKTEADKLKNKPKNNPNFATVKEVSPVRIQLDGESSILPVDVLIYDHVNVNIDSRVRISKLNNQYIIEGVVRIAN